MLLSLAIGTRAEAVEDYPAPADGTFTVSGRGNGHGHGMSQYGALGAAQAGKSWQQILAFYYPGTALGSIGNPTIRVRVAGLGGAIEAYPAQGLRVTWNLNDSSVLPTTYRGAMVARWRIVPSAKVPGQKTKFRLEYLPSGSSTWTYYATASVPLTGAFLNPSVGSVTTRRGSDKVVYSGQLRGTLIGNAGYESLVPVVALPMETYLRTVVPSEVFASWPQATLRAQAVAARSFAEYHRRYLPLSPTWYDVKDDTSSQVFKPTMVNQAHNEFASTNDAIGATKDTALTYAGAVAFTQFSASNGGWSSAGGKPYLVAQRDDWDAVSSNPYHAWTATLRTAAIESAYPAIGKFRQLSITKRNGLGPLGGRVLSATIVGSAGSVTRTGEQLRPLLGMGRTDWFKPLLESGPSFPRDVTGDGRGDLLGVVRDTGALRVYAGDGRGGASAVIVAEATGWNAYSRVLTAGAWDADSTSDVLVQSTSGDLFLRKGRGDGTFSAPVKIGAGWQAADLVFPVGDFDGDKKADLIVRMTTGDLYLYRGSGTGVFTGRKRIGTGWQGVSTALSPGDFSGDGASDLLYTTSTGDLWLYPGNGQGGFQPKRRIGTGWQVFDQIISPGDFDGDGHGDILARRPSDSGLYLYSGDGAGGAAGAKRVGTGWNVFSALLK
jgi:SpoIID/LytB domain protein